MTIAAIAVLLLGAGADDARVQRFAQMTVRQRIIIRVPATPTRPSRPIKWQEKRGPACIAASSLGGAQLTASDSVDLLLRGGTRLRARLKDKCPYLGYDTGFYLRPGADGKICADRDVIHARSGGQCEIDAFRTLIAKPAGKR